MNVVVPNQQYFNPMMPQIAPAPTIPLLTEDLKGSRSSVATAISAIMAEIGGVAKGGTNTHFGYSFVEATDIAAATQKLMAKHGLSILQAQHGISFFHNDSVMAVTYHFSLAHTDGSVWPCPIPMMGLSRCIDRGGFDDKALNKCHTAARKYFLIGLFNIPTKVDDADKGENDGHAGGAAEGGTRTKRSGNGVLAVAPKAAARPAPPVHPETGEVSPHAIPLGDDRNFIAWGQLFLAAIENAKSGAEIAQWTLLNSTVGQEMDKAAPKVKDRLTKRVVEITDALRLAKPPAPPDTPPDLSVKLPKRSQDMLNALNTRLSGVANEDDLNRQWTEWSADDAVRHGLQQDRAMLDRAAAIFESHRESFRKKAAA